MLSFQICMDLKVMIDMFLAALLFKCKRLLSKLGKMFLVSR